MAFSGKRIKQSFYFQYELTLLELNLSPQLHTFQSVFEDELDLAEDIEETVIEEQFEKQTLCNNGIREDPQDIVRNGCEEFCVSRITADSVLWVGMLHWLHHKLWIYKIKKKKKKPRACVQCGSLFFKD